MGQIDFQISNEDVVLTIHRPDEVDGIEGSILLAPRSYTCFTAEYKELKQWFEELDVKLNEGGFDLTRSARLRKTGELIRRL